MNFDFKHWRFNPQLCFTLKLLLVRDRTHQRRYSFVVGFAARSVIA